MFFFTIVKNDYYEYVCEWKNVVCMKIGLFILRCGNIGIFIMHIALRNQPVFCVFCYAIGTLLEIYCAI